MLILLQRRRLKQEVQRLLDGTNALEKGAPAADGSPIRLDEALQDSAGLSDDGEKDPRDIGSIDSSANHSSGYATPAQNMDPFARIPGVEPRIQDGQQYYVVSWTDEVDPANPHNWSYAARIMTTILLILVASVATIASSIDAAVIDVAAKDFHVSEVTEALGGTGIYLIGFGLGALICSPLSELLGRYLVYLGALVIFGIWIMAAALAPNFGAQLAFRFLAGLSSSAPLTVSGGTLSDMYNAKEKTWGFPIYAIAGFGGPVLGPVVGSYIPVTGVLSWHWVEWVVLIMDGLVIFLILAFMEETLASRLLEVKAGYFRQLTGDNRFMAESEMHGLELGALLKAKFSKPFVLAFEPIVVLFTIYLTVIYIVLFTFLDGYIFIFQDVYDINSGLTNVIFVALFVGIFLDVILVPIIYIQTNRQLTRDGDTGDGKKIHRESRLLFAMYGSPAIPIGLFWMAWTDYASISIWSPIIASILIGFGIISVFLSAYMYIIDSYEVYSASALTFVTLVRYVAAGGMTVVGVPMYKNLGPHYALTILACISVAAVPIPYALYKFGPHIRARSQYAVGFGGD